MRKYILIGWFALMAAVTRGQELAFGQITFAPYVAEDFAEDAQTVLLLKEKMNQAVTKANAIGGFDRRFIITVSVNTLSETETATIPQKTSLKASFTFYTGDGLAGTLFNSYNVTTTGIGDDHEAAVLSALRKVNPNDKGLQAMIEEGKERIVAYYNSTSPSLIKQAEGCMARGDYDGALLHLSAIPSLCKQYDRAQKLIVKCGEGIMKREKEQREWMKEQMQSAERIERERIQASAKVASAAWSALPKIVYNIVRWF